MSKEKIFKWDDTDISHYIKSYMFIKGYSVAKNLNQTTVALALAQNLHEGQYRKDGMPYIQHPLKVCTTLISYGIEDDVILAAALLHDILEDCQDKLPLNGKELITEFHLSKEVFDIISILTAALIKLSDRLHNSSTLYTFSFERMEKYIQETYTFLIPMASFCKKYYPEYTNAFSILKSNIYSLNHSMDIMMKKFQTSNVSQARVIAFSDGNVSSD